MSAFFCSLLYGRSIFYDSLSEDLTTAVNDSFTSERSELVFIEKTSEVMYAEGTLRADQGLSHSMFSVL